MKPTYGAAVFLREPKGISRPAEVTFDLGAMKIRSDDVEDSWDYRRLRTAAAGDDSQYLLITPDTPDGPFDSLVTRDPAFFAELAQHLPGDKSRFLHQFDRERSGVVSRKWRTLALAGLALAALLTGAWYLMTHWAVKEIVKRTPISAEVAWGDAMSSLVLQGKNPLREGPAFEAANVIWARLVEAAKAENPGYPLTLHVVDDPMVNAFAMPGGHVVLMTGLMRKADSPEEVAGVLAHEIQHVLKRHVAARVAQSAGTRLLISSVTGRGGLSSVTMTAQQLGELSYSREQESVADREAIRLMAMAGLPPGALVDILRKMDPKSSLRLPSFLSTHPQGETRLKTLELNAAKWKPEKTHPLGISWPEIRKSLGETL